MIAKMTHTATNTPRTTPVQNPESEAEVLGNSPPKTVDDKNKMDKASVVFFMADQC